MLAANNIHSLFAMGPEIKYQSGSKEIERHTIQHMWKRIKYDKNDPVSGGIHDQICIVSKYSNISVKIQHYFQHRSPESSFGQLQSLFTGENRQELLSVCVLSH